MALGAIDALKAAGYFSGGLSIPVIGVDATAAALDMVAQGALLYWDATNKRLTTTASGNTLAGYAAAPAGNGAVTVALALNA